MSLGTVRIVAVQMSLAIGGPAGNKDSLCLHVVTAALSPGVCEGPDWKREQAFDLQRQRNDP